MEESGELLGPEWLRTSLEQRKKLPLGDIFDDVLRELKRISEGGEFCDDICFVGMEVKPRH